MTTTAVEDVLWNLEELVDGGGADACDKLLDDAQARAKDGRTWEQYIEQRRGSPHHPLSRAELETKFRRTAASALDRSSVERLIGVVFDLDNHGDVRALTALLRPAAPALASGTAGR